MAGKGPGNGCLQKPIRAVLNKKHRQSEGRRILPEEAGKGGYGAIIVGRRGISEVPDFSMGRVTNKLIQIAKERAFGIVGY